MRDSADSYDPAFGRVRKTSNKRQRNRLDDEETFAKRNRHVRRLPTAEAAADAAVGLADDERWSTWDQSTPTERGPRPHPRWVVTDLAAIDTELHLKPARRPTQTSHHSPITPRHRQDRQGSGRLPAPPGGARDR